MSNLLEKASIITTPTAYSDGVLHSVKPEQTLGSELVTNGNFATDSDWAKGTGWTISGGTANQDGSNSILRQTSVTSTNTRVKVTFDLTNYGGSGALQIKFAPNIYPITLNGNGSYTVFTDGTNSINGDLQIIATGGFVGSIDNVSVKEVINADFTFTRNDAGTRVNASGNIESVGVDLPRIDYLGGTGSLLLEPEATNTATDSNDFTTGSIFITSGNPGVDGGVLTSNQTTSPDGTNNAWKLVDSNNGNIGVTSFRFYSTNVTSGNFNTISLFVKKQGNNDWFYINVGGYDFPTNNTFFNISNGTLGNVGADVTASIDDYGNGWYRISVTFQTTTDVQGAVQLRLASSNGGQSVLRDGTNGAYIYGLQAESHATREYATSYIPTSGSVVTRAADLALDAGSSDLINSTEGVLYLEVAALTSINYFESITLSDGGPQNRIRFQLLSILNKGAVQVQVGGVNQMFRNVDFTDITDFNKVAIKYKQNDFSVWLNGVKIYTDTSGTIPTLSELNFSSGSNFNTFNGKVKCVAVFKEALTDAELTCLTTPNISRIFNDRVLWDGGIIESLECVTL